MVIYDTLPFSFLAEFILVFLTLFVPFELIFILFEFEFIYVLTLDSLPYNGPFITDFTFCDFFLSSSTTSLNFCFFSISLNSLFIIR